MIASAFEDGTTFIFQMQKNCLDFNKTSIDCCVCNTASTPQRSLSTHLKKLGYFEEFTLWILIRHLLPVH